MSCRCPAGSRDVKIEYCLLECDPEVMQHCPSIMKLALEAKCADCGIGFNYYSLWCNLARRGATSKCASHPEHLLCNECRIKRGIKLSGDNIGEEICKYCGENPHYKIGTEDHIGSCSYCTYGVCTHCGNET